MAARQPVPPAGRLIAHRRPARAEWPRMGRHVACRRTGTRPTPCCERRGRLRTAVRPDQRCARPAPARRRSTAPASGRGTSRDQSTGPIVTATGTCQASPPPGRRSCDSRRAFGTTVPRCDSTRSSARPHAVACRGARGDIGAALQPPSAGAAVGASSAAMGAARARPRRSVVRIRCHQARAAEDMDRSPRKERRAASQSPAGANILTDGDVGDPPRAWRVGKPARSRRRGTPCRATDGPPCRHGGPAAAGPPGKASRSRRGKTRGRSCAADRNATVGGRRRPAAATQPRT